MLKLLGIILALACGIAFAAARYINRRRLFDAPDVEGDGITVGEYVGRLKRGRAARLSVKARDIEDRARAEAIRIQEQARWN